MKLIDNFLNSITMYRLILYYLIFLFLGAFGISLFGKLPFTPLALASSAILITVFSLSLSKIFETFFKVQTNIESSYITAFILVLIFTPVKTLSLENIFVLFSVSLLSIASKYILVINKKHIFNPVAIGAVLAGILFKSYASWWIGTSIMLPLSLVGVIIARKIRRFDLVFNFFATSFLVVFGSAFLKGNADVFLISKKIITGTPIVFFAFVMLTEPLTTPSTTFLQSIYGALVGILFTPSLHIAPEMALSLGNIFSYIVSPKIKLILKLKEKHKLASDTYDFIFNVDEKMDFKPGQYMEWTLGHKNTDSRGNRRYFTLASSPTEKEIRIAVKFNQKGSSFKREMLSMNKDSAIVASQIGGDFTLPDDINNKLVFIAGGIGITPFRSMLKFLIDKKIKRNIILIYSEKNKEKMIYKNVFNEAAKKLGIKIIYFETEKRGHITKDIIQKEIPDYKSRKFYISGSEVMVSSVKTVLRSTGLTSSQIKTDYFPGF